MASVTMGPESSGWTAALAASAIRRREISCQELVRDTLERLHSVDRRLNAFLLTLDEAALDRARQLDERLARGEDPGPMAGVPVALKDNLCLAGTPTTCGSRILEGFRPPYSATAVQRLEQAGAIVIGKTNMDEFAMGSSTENSAFGTVRNPWNLDCVPGGSSGGSAAAVAAGQAMAALGSDTGGSVRQPASFCGVVGLKPTYGRVSRYGLVAYASSLDQIGPLTRDVTDAALVMNAIAGPDPADSTCASAAPPDYLASLRPDVRGARVGLPREMFGHGVHPAIAQIVRQGVDQLESLGAEIVEVSLPTSDFALAVYYILAPAEASSNLARYDGVEYGLRVEDQHDVVGMYMATRDRGFGDEVKRRILMGTYALSAGYYDAYYLKAQKVRTLVRGDFARAFDHCDILASPTSPAPAFRVGEKAEDPMAMKLADVLTVPANIAGIPAISVPCGLLDGLPVGLQLMARPFDETTLLRFAYTYEQATGHHRQRPDR